MMSLLIKTESRRKINHDDHPSGRSGGHRDFAIILGTSWDARSDKASVTFGRTITSRPLRGLNPSSRFHSHNNALYLIVQYILQTKDGKLFDYIDSNYKSLNGI